jgi:hypothetical protein
MILYPNWIRTYNRLVAGANPAGVKANQTLEEILPAFLFFSPV